MKFVLMFGPQAVGKMTVGQELEKITGLKLFHNHMTIELVSPFFYYDTETGKRLVNLFRREIFKEVAKSNLKGLIFTKLWFFDKKEHWAYINSIIKIFKSKGAKIYYVELEADIKERLRRNRTENRLKNKPTTRDMDLTEKNIKENDLNHRLNSRDCEITEKNYIRINNTKLSPEKVAKIIKQKFQL